MRVKDPFSEAEEPYNLIPLTDMAFNLLIFFMAATTFAQVEREMGVQLPRSSTFTTLSQAPTQLIINIDNQGNAVVSHKTYDTNALSELVAGQVRRNAETSVLIRADERGLVKGFAAVARVCKQAGVKETKIGYLTDSATPPAGGGR